MPQLFAVILCVMILAGLAGLVRLEYKRARKGPRLSSTAFFKKETEGRGKSANPKERSRAIQHEIGY